MNNALTTALIAEDEPLLALNLQAELARAWPALQVVGIAGDGLSAVAQALQLRPDVLLLDIRMPGQSGLEAAAELADRWPDGVAFPALVFVTAYDQYAVQAFERQAVDYLLKPVQPARLALTVARVQALLATRAAAATAPAQVTLDQLRALLTPAPSAGNRLQAIQASVGNTLHTVPLHEVLVLEAADKYLRVLTAEREYLIRTPLKELLPQLDAQQFWQIHRGTVVQAAGIASVSRDEAGRQWVHLRARPERLAVSRLYAHLFKAM